METNKCKHQYPRTIENKVRVCVLCGYAEETNELPEDYGDDRRKDNILDSEKPPPRAVGVVTPDARQHTNTESYNELSDEAKEQIVKIAKTVTVDSANFEYIAKTGRINGGLWMDIQRVVADGYRLAIQSKEEEIAVQNSAIYSLQTNLTAVTNELDRWKLKYGALATGYEMKVKALEEELKAKEKEAESLVNEVNTIADHANKLWEGNFRVLEEQLKAKDEEIAKLKLQNGQAYYADKIILVEKIDSLLSQSTDKP